MHMCYISYVQLIAKEKVYWDRIKDLNNRKKMKLEKK